MGMDPDGTEGLLQQLRSGDTGALAGLLEHFRPRLRRLVQLRMDVRARRRVDPSDVLQEVYCDAEKRVQGYLDGSSVGFYIWLRGLAMERLLMLHRRHLGAACRAAGRECALPAESSIALAAGLLGQRRTPSRLLMREELRHLVEGALHRLSSQDREVILMRHYEGMSNREVAQALGIGDPAASMRHGRALFRLKQLLSGELDSDWPS